jgi:hypothetical protein
MVDDVAVENHQLRVVYRLGQTTEEALVVTGQRHPSQVDVREEDGAPDPHENSLPDGPLIPRLPRQKTLG